MYASCVQQARKIDRPPRNARITANARWGCGSSWSPKVRCSAGSIIRRWQDVEAGPTRRGRRHGRRSLVLLPTRQDRTETAEQTAAQKTAALRLRLRQGRVDALRPLQDGALRDARVPSHARAHAPVCYFDSGVQAMDAGEPRKAAKLFETSVEKADKLPQEERVKRRSAAYLALGRARQMAKAL